MSEALATYLHDHLAGAMVALNLMEALRAEYDGEPLGHLADELSTQIGAEREVLRMLADRMGARGNPLKEATAWIAEKLSRIKLGRTVAGEFGTFEALEGLSLGILGKLALWRALARIAPGDARLGGVDYELLIARSIAQHAAVERARLEAAEIALRSVEAHPTART